MKKSFTKIVCAVFVMVFFAAGSGFACGKYDFGDAAGYGVAKHQTAEWQYLGSGSNREYSSKFDDMDQYDDGVFWSINGGDFANTDYVFQVGDKVEFKFEMWSAGYGVHDYDQIKAWVDWGQDGVFDNVADNILAEQYWKPYWQQANEYGKDWSWRNARNYWYSTTTEYYSDAFTITEDMIGDLVLRARVSCWDTPFEQTTAYGKLYQGEVEDYRFDVEKSAVPEPATLMLLGIGLISMAGVSRRKTNLKDS